MALGAGFWEAAGAFVGAGVPDVFGDGALADAGAGEADGVTDTEGVGVGVLMTLALVSGI